MNARTPGLSRGTARLLQIAMMIQILLGLTRYFGPMLGWVLPRSVWSVHPVLGLAIAIIVLVALRPRDEGAPQALRRIARFAPLAPLSLGLAIAFGLRLGALLVPLHMLIGLTALSLVDNVLKQLVAASPPGEQPVVSSPAQV